MDQAGLAWPVMTSRTSEPVNNTKPGKQKLGELEVKAKLEGQVSRQS